MSTLNSLHPEIRTALDNNELTREKIYRMSAPYTQVERISHEHFPRLPDTPSYSQPTGMWFGSDSIYLTLRQIDTFHEAAPLLRTLRKYEWKLDADGMQKDTSSFRWTLTKEIRPNLIMRLFITGIVTEAEDASTDVCRRVQIGTKTVLEPIYEVVCPEGVDGEDDMTHLDNEMSEEPTHA